SLKQLPTSKKPTGKRQQHIGLVTQLFWESASGSSSSAGKRLYVSTDSNVIAALNSVNGQIVWRRVFEEERRGEVDDMLYTGNYLLTVLGGNRLQAWQPGSGTIMWEVAMKGETTHTGKVGFAEESGSRGVAVGLSSERVYGVNIRDGTTLWDVELPNSCEVAENSYLMCVCPSSESLQALIANTVTFEDREFLLYLENTGSEEVTVFGIDLETGESLGELGHSFNYAHHNGKPTQFYGLLAKRAKDGKLAYKLAIVSQDYSLQLIHKSGKVGWRREECLAYVYAVEMVDLPVSENQAKFEDEFGSHEDNVTFIMQQVERLQGVKHHTAIMEGGEEEEDEEDLLRDEFSLHKMVILVTRPGKASGRGHLYAFNPITAETVSGMSGTGEHLPYSVKQAFVLGTWDENFMKAFIMLDDSHMITVDPVWTVNLQNTRLNMKITNIVSRPANEHIHSVGRVLGDRSVLYKYLNPNLVVITTEGEEPATSQQKAYPVVNVYVVDVVTGHMVFHGNHRKASGPLHVVHSENWVVYGYLNMKQHRYEMAGLEMYEGKIQSNVTAFSSLSAPVTPLVLRHSFIFPLPVASMATTVTEKGITAKDLLIALKNGGIFSLPKAFLDPRRPLAPTQETQEEGTLPYIPELPVHTEGIINYNRTLFHVRGLHTAPTGLESTSLVLAYGLDLFQTRVQPSKMFDVLKEDFEHYVIAIVVLSMLLVSFITKKLASRKALNKQWKIERHQVLMNVVLVLGVSIFNNEKSSVLYDITFLYMSIIMEFRKPLNCYQLLIPEKIKCEKSDLSSVK
ncbi:EMC1-like protein, partial [Mya arenaria]